MPKPKDLIEATANVAVDLEEAQEIAVCLKQLATRFRWLATSEFLSSAERVEYDILGGVLCDVRNEVKSWAQTPNMPQGIIMTKDEEITIRNIIARLRKPDCGCSNSVTGWGSEGLPEAIARVHQAEIECVSRIYIDTWMIGALECLLPEQRDTKTAVDLSS